MITSFDYLELLDREELLAAAGLYETEEEFVQDWKADRDLRRRFGSGTEEILRGAFRRAHEEATENGCESEKQPKTVDKERR